MIDVTVLTARQDRAIEQADDDALDRAPFVDSIIRALVHTQYDLRGRVSSRHATGFVVGLTGSWGLGKSSVMNLLQEQLKSYDHVAVAMLNPWLFKGRDELVQAYFNALRDALGKTLKERGRDIQAQLEKYKGAIGVGGAGVAALVDLHGGSGVATAWWQRSGKTAVDKIAKPASLSPDEERRSLEVKLAAANIAVVVLIDELDRVEDEEVRAVAQLVKAVGDIKGISYLVAYDPTRVAQALGRGTDADERRRTGEAYLEKIVQYAIPLRPLFEDDARALLGSALATYGVVLEAPASDYQRAIIDELIRSARTPREIKRLVGAHAVLEEIVRGEICPYDVLGYSWLVTKAPGVRDAIAADFERVVRDPGEREILRRMGARNLAGKKDETVTDVLGVGAQAHEQILKVLFPRFGQDDETNAGNRIAKRRNLVRLLYLGNPPGMLRRVEIERIWSLPDAAALDTLLQQLVSNSELPRLLDRLVDLLPQLPTNGDVRFWPAVSRALIRRSDWIKGQEPLGGLVNDAANLIFTLGRTNQAGAVRFRSIFDALVESGDLLIAPWLLRRHMFAHGIVGTDQSRDRDHILSAEETKSYVQRELPRYAAAVESGEWLRRLPDTEVLYCILNMQYWTDELRASLTDQLVSADALLTLAGLLTPPGIISSPEVMNKLFDADTVLARIVALVNRSGEPEDDWLATALKRLVATIRGDDPLWIDRHGDDDYIINGGAERTSAEP
jgi:hypothetical protein